MSYHDRVMNIPGRGVPGNYAIGHRDARHSAAEIACAADAEIERLQSRIKAIESAAGNVCWYSYGDCDQDVQDAVMALERLVPDYCIVYRTADTSNEVP
jgi:hypothetical protein